MQKILCAFSAAAILALASPGVAKAAPITLSRTSATLTWTGRLDWKGDKTFLVHASSAEPVSMLSADCRSNAGKNAIAQVRQTGTKTVTHNGHTVHEAIVSVDFSFSAGSCNVVFGSGNDRATLHLENSGRPGRE